DNMLFYGDQVHMSSPAPYLFQTPGHTPIRDYYLAAIAGREEEARRIWATLARVRVIEQKWINAPWSLGYLPKAAVKAWSEMLGLSGGNPRLPIKPLTQAYKDELRRDLVWAGLLEKVAVPEEQSPASDGGKGDGGPADDMFGASKFDVPKWLDENERKYHAHDKPNGTTVYELEECPFRPGHHGGACILQDSDGSISGHCHHPQCAGKTWADFRKAIDPHFRETQRPPSKKTIKDSEYLARCHLQQCPPAYLYRGDVWYYAAGIWRRQEVDDLKIGIRRTLMRVFGRYGEFLRQQKSDNGPPSVTEKIVNDVLGCFRSILPQIPREWDMPCWIDGTPANVLVVADGIVDLDTGERRGHSKRLLAQFKLPYAYDPTATCPTWDRTLKLIFDDSTEIELLQEMFGYSLVSGNKHRVIWVLQGATSGGKGLITVVLCLLLGRENATSIRARRFNGQFALWNARFKLLLIVPDINGRKPLPDAFVEAAKTISGGDPIDIDGKNKHAVCEVLPAKILMVSNDVVRMEDDSAALFNRIVCLKFIHHFFPEGHKLHEPGRTRDPDLSDKLAKELPGILNWALAGLRRLKQKNNFSTPQASVELREELETEGAPVQTYVFDCLDKDPDKSVSVDDAYRDYSLWCHDQGCEPLGVTDFGRALRAAIPIVERKRRREGSDRQYYYFGVVIKPARLDEVKGKEVSIC
ncbi:MAG: phage/plasmid primase, P4 family, partial [Thermoguttaceae bacterium]